MDDLFFIDVSVNDIFFNSFVPEALASFISFYGTTRTHYTYFFIFSNIATEDEKFMTFCFTQ
jgi:hypothetical protein